VLIVGAGPAGLALAIELGTRGVPCLVIEKNDRVGYAPRAKTTNLRTREHLRRWGIADRLKAASPLGEDYPPNITFCTRLSGYRLMRFEGALGCSPGRNPLYAENSQWIPQYVLEELLREKAQSLPGVDVRFNCRLESFTQDGAGVRARFRDLARESEFDVAADYLVGADGARSTVREAIGATMTGVRALSRNYNIIFEAPGLAQAHKQGQAIMYWQVNNDVPSIIGPMDAGDKWYFMPTRLGEGQRLTDAEAAAMIARATGIALDYRILSADEWTASRLIADRYRDGRVFLIGDACHLHPPFGGFGMNMGIADGVDLGWKMAAVLGGWGGPALLASYERERRPVHEFVMDEAVANHSVLSNALWMEGIEAAGEEGDRVRAQVGARIRADKLREFHTLGVVLGYHYAGSPIIVGDGTQPPARDFVNYVPSATPGCRAPHAWLHDGTSLYDHLGPGFTLLVAADAEPGDVDAARREAQAHGVPLKVLPHPAPALPDLYRARLALIRPDQHVAWRGDAWRGGDRVFARATGSAAA
jgi:2-polyprenyl-6-methoxyphenol hydroxylase-like FAD-dependent oxidoreductase